jgi:hypothetical protein
MAAGENQTVLLDGSFLNERDADEEYASLNGSYINDEAAAGGGGGGGGRIMSSIAGSGGLAGKGGIAGMGGGLAG